MPSRPNGPSVASLISEAPSGVRGRLAELSAALSLPSSASLTGATSSSPTPAQSSSSTLECLSKARADVLSAPNSAPSLRRALEALLVAALGHSDHEVRDEAVVLLNVLYDGHDLQANDALPVTVAEVGDGEGDEAGVRVVLPLVREAFGNPGALSVRMYCSGASVSSPGFVDLGAAAKQRTLPVTVLSEENKKQKTHKSGASSGAPHDSARGTDANTPLAVTFPPFTAPGFVDWVLISSDSNDSRMLSSRRVAGRFVVQRRGARAEALVEVPVDEVGATWDEGTGVLRCRGSFEAAKGVVGRIKASGATAVYFMGALERPRDVERGADGEIESASSPFVVARRDAPAQLLGGEDSFKSLVEVVKGEGMTAVVDAIDRVSKTRADRGYAGLNVSIRQRNATGSGTSGGAGDVLVPHPGTDARENQWEETVLLNYRDVNVWNAGIRDIKTLASSYGIRGVRMDNAQSGPLIMEVDAAEMFRVDTDGEMHYSEEDRLLGKVVYPNSEQGYWSTDAATYRGYPNPYLVKLCREIWAEYADFLIIAESHFHREAQLSASGTIPHSIRVPQILASINGQSLRRDGSVVRLPEGRRSTARTLSRLLKTDRETMPKNYILLGCACTHLSPYPAVLYGRRSWLAVDLLYFLPHLPMLLLGEDAGRAYRHNMAPTPVEHVSEVSERDVNFDEVLPKSPKKKTRAAGSSPTAGGVISVPPFSSQGTAALPPKGSLSTGLPPSLSIGTLGDSLGGGPAPPNHYGPGGVGGNGDTNGGLPHNGFAHSNGRANASTATPSLDGSVGSVGDDPNALSNGGNPVQGLAMGIGSLANMLNGGSVQPMGGGSPLAVSGNGVIGGSVGLANGATSTGAMMAHGHGGLTPLSTVGRGGTGMGAGPGGKSPSLPRRGSMSSLGLKISSSPKQQQSRSGGMVRSMSRDDMRGTSIRNMSSEELRQMDALESATRAEIGPETGFDLSQIMAHYSHRSLLRQEHSVFRGGRFCVIAPDPASKDSVVSFARFNDEDLVIVAANLRDDRDGPEFANGVSVDLDLRVLWEDDIGLSPGFAAKSQHLFRFVNLFTDAEHEPEELLTLEEAVFRKVGVHLPPLGIVVLRLVHVASPGDASPAHVAHFKQCMTRLMENDATNSLKDARENYAIASIARGASSSLHEFAESVEKVRAGLVAEGCDGYTVDGILQLCLQRASALLPSVVYENATPPKDFDPPTGERVSAYLALLSTVSATPGLLETARVLVKRSSKIGPLVFLTAELGRFSTAGGLGVMVDELTKGLASLGLEVYVVSPYYAVNRKNQSDYLGSGFSWTRNISINIGTGLVDVGVFEGIEDGVNLIFLERKDFFSKVYANPGTAMRHLQCIVLMSLGSLEIFCQKAIKPAMVVTNDWLPSMAAGYARNGHFGDYFSSTTFFHLIHNLGDSTYEGRCYAEVEGDDMGGIHRLPRHCIVDPLWTRVVINPSRVALLCSDNWGTVSPTYMKELLSGHDLSPLLQMARRPFAYPNGIPMATRESILRTKGAPDHLTAKALLQKRYFGMDVPDYSIPLFAFVGRVTSQKGVHLILNAVEDLIRHTEGRIQILVGGPANCADPYAAGCANHMHELRYRHPLCFWAAPDDFFTDGPLVNLGANFGVMPSAFEPGGIVQQEFFIAGTPVIAFKTGGLKDTVHEWHVEEGEGNGFLFDEYNHENFTRAMKRALRTFSYPDEYAELRVSARTTTIDVSQVAWAWSSEFHRMRNAIYSRADVLQREYNELMLTDLQLAKEAGSVVESARMIEISWSEPVAPGEIVYIQGDWDGWSAEHKLTPVDGASQVLATQLLLPEGEYEYKFKVGTKWVHSEDRPTRVSNGEIQATNNLLVVE